MIRLLLAAVAIAASATVVTDAPAAAEPCPAGAGAGSSAFNAVAECSVDGVSAHNVGSTQAAAGGTTYSYEPACVRGDGIVGEDFYGCGGQMVCGDDGDLFHVWAHQPDGSSQMVGTYCYQSGEVPAAQVLTPAMVLRAFQQVPLPESTLSVQPPGGRTLVNLDTIFSTEAEGFVEAVQLLGRRVELDIRPTSYRWVAGDGTSQVTDWPGRPWAEGVAMEQYVSHVYRDAKVTVRPRVDTTWSARYRVGNGPWRDISESVTIEGEPATLRVLTARPVLVG